MHELVTVNTDRINARFNYEIRIDCSNTAHPTYVVTDDGKARQKLGLYESSILSTKNCFPTKFNMGVKWAENLNRATEKWAVKLTRARVQRTVGLSGRRGSRNDVVSEIGVDGKAKGGRGALGDKPSG